LSSLILILEEPEITRQVMNLECDSYNVHETLVLNNHNSSCPVISN
jgi:hypothetical protein